MEVSIQDVPARFAEAANAAASGERVVVTKDGAPFVELVPAMPAPVRPGGLDGEALERHRQKMGWTDTNFELPDYFDDPAYSRKVLGLDV